MGTSDSRFPNRLYRAEVRRTTCGSPILKITATNPNGHAARRRQLAAFLYEIAAQLERRLDGNGEPWVVSPEAWNGTITIELAGEGEAERTRADALVAEVIAENDLAGEEASR